VYFSNFNAFLNVQFIENLLQFRVSRFADVILPSDVTDLRGIKTSIAPRTSRSAVFVEMLKEITHSLEMIKIWVRLENMV
jgi:hypothetical protein